MRYIFVFVIGILIGWLMTCNYVPSTIEKIKTEIIHDTVHVDIKTPSRVKYITKTQTDSILLEIHDSSFVEIIKYLPDSVRVPVNTYQDSIKRVDYTLTYNIQTLGSLIDFDYTLSFYPQVYVKHEIERPKWIGSIGISDKLNYKVGAGYRGWVIESEFNKRLNFNQVYLTKQFYFK